METQHNLAKELREVEGGYEVGITHRKKMVARILPAEPAQPVAWPDFAARAATVWGGSKPNVTVEELLDEARGDR